ncbi:MAG: GNAT family N-acetyltransferase [Chloroflexota bacterium]
MPSKTSELTIKYLDIPNLTEQEWDDLIALRIANTQEASPDDPVNSYESIRKMITGYPDYNEYIWFWVAYDANDNCVAMMQVVHPKPDNPDYEANKKLMWCWLFVTQDRRRKGIATQLIPIVMQQAQKFGATIIQSGTSIKSGHQFMEMLEMQKAFDEKVNRVAIKDIDWDLMAQWMDAGRTRNPEVELIRYDHLPPEKDMDVYCQLVTDLVRMVPLEDMEKEEYTLLPEELRKQYTRFDELGRKNIVFVARDTDGAMMGMTEMFHDPEKPTLGYVGLTAVLKNYQGRGIGKYLKARMTYDIRDNFPAVESISTDNASSNAPMLSINERMGFTVHKHWIAYKIAVSDLANTINND